MSAPEVRALLPSACFPDIRTTNIDGESKPARARPLTSAPDVRALLLYCQALALLILVPLREQTCTCARPLTSAPEGLALLRVTALLRATTKRLLYCELLALLVHKCLVPGGTKVRSALEP